MQPIFSEPASPAATPATSTPPSSSSRSGRGDVAFCRGAIRIHIQAPSSLRPLVIKLRNEFLATEPDSPGKAGLLADFMHFILQRVDSGDSDDDEDELLDVLRGVHSAFECTASGGEDVHAVAAALPADSTTKKHVVSTVMRVSSMMEASCRPSGSALIRAVREGRARLFVVFGGQGIDTYLDQLASLRELYHPIVAPLLRRASAHLQDLLKGDGYSPYYAKGLDCLAWIEDADSRPDAAYLASAPVSFPLVGLVQLVCFAAAARLLDLDPAGVIDVVSGSTGHSQGIIVAAFVAASADWASFDALSLKALSLLVSLGVRTQSVFRAPPPGPALVRDAVNHGEGSPSPMLSVRHLPLATIQALVAQTNLQLPPDAHIEIGLHNGADNFVLVGPHISLHSFNLRLRALKAPAGQGQARIPFDKRRPHVANRFLPVSAPFHSTYLAAATPLVLQDAVANDVRLRGSDLRCPVFVTTLEAADLRSRGDADIVAELVRLVTEQPLHWASACAASLQTTHVLDFGPGRGGGGAGGLVHALVRGRGVRVLLAGELEGGGGAGDYGGTAELVQRHGGVVVDRDWGARFAPRVVRTSSSGGEGKLVVSTKMSRLLGLPPVMVAGMTPTTGSVELVAGAMAAGFHVEFATGGFHGADALECALHRLAAATPPGRGISCNLIYASPTSLRWKLALLRRLRADAGIPIEGLTFGAGVPSLDVATDYIATFPGLRHISFKPGSVDAIRQVIAIAAASPRFPVILQWTGGRGGGHHSFEDFHDPIARTYPAIREHDNIVLVAGSGFGDVEGSLPYLTGDWAHRFGLPPMPFDGILVASRVMVAREAATSLAAKRLITSTAGVDDAQWTKTYDGPAGGVVTVISEMGEPIHKLATRGTLLWAELDRTVFSITDKGARAKVLKQKRDYIIRRLNADFQKVWFGWSEDRGHAAGLDEMTYAEVVSRLVELTFVRHQRRWIDESFRKLTYDFMRHAASRFMTASAPNAAIPTLANLDDPESCAQRLFDEFPGMRDGWMGYHDVQHFLGLCRRKGQKPVPFVPALDENFETWFKKDSLWQSEDLDAVVNQDVGRVCILQGPVAVQYSKTADEPIKDILEGLHAGFIAQILGAQHRGGSSTLPFVECFGLTAVMSSSEDKSLDSRLFELGGPNNGWKKAFFTSKTVVQGRKVVENPIRKLLADIRPLYADVRGSSVSLFSDRVDKVGPVKIIDVAVAKQNVIELRVLGNLAADNQQTVLLLKFQYQPNMGFAPIHEIIEDRLQRIRSFYWRVWFGNESVEQHKSVHDEYVFGPTKLSADAIERFSRAIECPASFSGHRLQAPMDFSIVAAWRPMIEPLFARELQQGDLLNLVHLSNGFRWTSGAAPLAECDTIEVKSHVAAVVNQDSGKRVHVVGQLFRDGKMIVQLDSQFLYRGRYSDEDSTFQITDEPATKVELATQTDLELLRSRPWLRVEHPFASLLSTGTRVFFRLRTERRGQQISVTGDVEASNPQSARVRIGSVNFSGSRSCGNPVLAYLKRHGQPELAPVPLSNPAPLLSPDEILMVEVPPANALYAEASGDLNPIHVSPALASYAGLPGTITHGMHTSALVRCLVEKHLCPSEPGRFKSFSCSFVGMVLPGQKLRVSLQHTAMAAGQKLVRVEAANTASDAVVLVGEAEIEGPKTAFVFTGQGSQKPGMGMDLYAESAAAREVWDRADQHFLENYGFLITEIVKKNPKRLVIHFGGQRGQKVRQHYMELVFLEMAPDGTAIRKRVFPDITEKSICYTFSSPEGLLFATQFTQPALTIMEIAAFRDLQQRGLVSDESYFAGHSLGEYSALCAVVDFAPIESLMSIVFYRGLTMQHAVTRNAAGRSGYGMCAVNPSRVSKPFDEATLELLVGEISAACSSLFEVVNYNVEGQQYVCAGNLRALKCLGDVLDHVHSQSLDLKALLELRGSAEGRATGALSDLVQTILQQGNKHEGGGFIELKRGRATIPLPGIDVPFHSSSLRAGVAPFRHHLRQYVSKDAVHLPRLRGKYVPNLTATPFDVSREYLDDVLRLTRSEVVRDILLSWDEYECWQPGMRKPGACLSPLPASPLA